MEVMKDNLKRYKNRLSMLVKIIDDMDIKKKKWQLNMS